jgi:hypothetical protein
LRLPTQQLSLTPWERRRIQLLAPADAAIVIEVVEYLTQNLRNGFADIPQFVV